MKTLFRTTLVALLAICAPLRAQVTFDRILNAEREPQNWLSYSATVSNQRFSRLDQIDTRNVKSLELQWVWQARSLEKFEATALVVDGVLYTVQAPNDVVALDAATGRVFWTYHHEPAADARPCCGRVNRGLAILGDTLYMGTIDAHLLAIDAKSGQLVWDTKVGNSSQMYAITMAPNVIKDKVIVGTAGGDMGIRGYIAAYDAKTGKELWRATLDNDALMTPMTYQGANGKQFVVMFPKSQADESRPATEQVNVTLNWFEDLKAKAPRK